MATVELVRGTANAQGHGVKKAEDQQARQLVDKVSPIPLALVLLGGPSGAGPEPDGGCPAGDGPATLAAFQAILTLAEALPKRDPANTQWQVDVAMSCSKEASADQLLPVFTRRAYLQRGREILVALKYAGRQHSNQDLTAWFEEQIQRMDGGSKEADRHPSLGRTLRHLMFHRDQRSIPAASSSVACPPWLSQSADKAQAIRTSSPIANGTSNSHRNLSVAPLLRHQLACLDPQLPIAVANAQGKARRRRPGHGEEQSGVSCCWARSRRVTAQALCSGVSWRGAGGGGRQGLQLP